MGETATSVYVEFDKDSSDSDSDPQYRVSWGMDMSMEVSGVTSEEDTDTRQGLILEGLEPGTMYTIGVERKIGDDMWGSKAEATATTLSKAYSSGSDSNQYYDIARGETIELDLSDLMVLAISSPGAMDDWDKNRGMAGSPVSATLTVSSSSSSVTAERTPDAVYSTSEKLSITGVKAGTGTVTVTAKFSDSGYDDVVARLPVKVTDDLMPRFTADVVELTWNVDMNADGSGTDLEIDLTSYLNEASVEELNADCSDEDENADNTVNCDQEFTYSIAVDGPGNYFEVDEETGMITVDSPSLDPLEHGDVFQITATVTDVNGHKDTMEFDITVSEDTNDLPMKRDSAKPLTLNPMSQSAIENGTGTRTRTATFSRYFSDRETNSRDLCYKIEGGSGSGKTATATTTGDATGKKIADATLNRVTGRKDSSCHGDELTITMRLPSNNPMDEDSALLGEYAAYDATFEVKACEPTNKSQCTDTVEVSVKVVYGTNSAPTLRAIAYADGTPYSASGGFTVAENTPFSLKFTADDAQGHDNICISQSPDCRACKGSTDKRFATPAAGGFSHEKTLSFRGLNYESTNNGAHTLNVCATDLSGERDTLAFNIKVTDVEEAPRITSITEGGSRTSHIYMLVDDDPRVLTINATDGDGDDLTYHAECVGSNCTGGVRASASGNVLTIHAPTSALADGSETYEIEVMVTDSTGLSHTTTLMVSVKNENLAPYFVSGLSGISMSTPENTARQPNRGPLPVTLDVRDPDGDDELLSSATVMGTNAFRASVRNQGSRKVVQISVARPNDLNYEADASASISDANFFEFTLEISDSYGGTDSIDVTIELTDINEAPYQVGSIPNQRILEGVEVCGIEASDFFKDHDERDQDRGLDFEIRTTRSNDARVRVSGNSMICIEGLRARSGRSTVSVTATDHGGLTSTDTFYLTVEPNPSPTVVGTGIPDQTVQVGEDPIKVQLMDHFSNGNPTFPEKLTFTVSVADPTKATCVLRDDLVLRCYGDARGNTDVTVTATDEADQSENNTFALEVTQNDPPMVVDGYFEQLFEDQDIPTVWYIGKTYPLLDVDGAFTNDGDELQYTVESSNSDIVVPAIKYDSNNSPWVEVVLREDSSPPDEGEPITVTITAKDESNQEAQSEFSITVFARNDAPTVTMQIPNSEIYVTRSPNDVALSGVFSDEDVSSLSYTIGLSKCTDDASAAAACDSVLDAIMRRNSVRYWGISWGMVTVTVTATDDIGQSTSTSFEVSVVNAPPMLSQDYMFADQMMTVENPPLRIDLADAFFDHDGHDMTYTVLSADSEIVTAELDGTHLVVTAVMKGETEVMVTPNDGIEDGETQSFKVTVGNAEPNYVGMLEAPENMTVESDPAMISIDGAFMDPDGDELTYSVTSADESIVMVSLSGTNLTITPVSKGMTMVTITASDGHLNIAAALEVTVHNSAPKFVGMLDDQTMTVESDPIMIAIEGLFMDPDGDELTYEVSSDDDAVATATLSSSHMTLTAVSKGMTTVTVTASDGDIHSSVSFNLTIANAEPNYLGTLNDQIVTKTLPMTVSVEGAFMDPDGDELTYEATSEDTAIATVSMSGTDLTIDGVAAGTTTISVTASDGELQVTGNFMVTIETIPNAVGTIADQTLQVGGAAETMDVAQYFADEDGDSLTYTAAGTGNAATIAITGTEFSMTPYTKGTTSVVITAADPKNRSATQEFMIMVSDSEIKMVAADAMAGHARSIMAATSSVIGARLEEHGRSNDGASLSISQYLPDNSINDYSFTKQRQDLMGFDTGLDTGWSQVDYDGSSNITLPDLNNVKEQGFSRTLNGDGGIGSFAIWGAFDFQNFEGAGYEGEANSWFVGVDIQSNECWLFGVSVSGSTAESDYTFGTATQNMETSLTTILPYVSYERVNGKSAIWGTFGRGSGEAETTIVNASSETSDLSLNMGIFGGRHEFAQMGSMTVAFRGDAAFANMETDSGSGAVDSLEAGVSRIRAALEGSFTVDTGNGGKMTTYGEVAFRNDGGDGQNGSGVEVAGGLSFNVQSLELEARGRLLASHSADDFSENGISVMLSFNPSQDASGFSLSLTPNWGQGSEMSGLIWEETAQLGSMTPYNNVFGNATGPSMNSNMTYGFLFNNDQYLLAPFVDYQSSGGFGKTVTFGTDLKQLIQSSFEINLRAFVGASTGLENSMDTQAGIQAQIRF